MCGGVNLSDGVRRSLCRGVCKCKVCVCLYMYVCRGMFMWGLHLSSVIRDLYAHIREGMLGAHHDHERVGVWCVCGCVEGKCI